MDRKKLSDFGFVHAGDFYIDGKRKINVTNWSKEALIACPGIYCWLAYNPTGSEEEVLYVGKYGKGVKKRFAEHRGGMSGGSASGVAKAETIKELIETNGQSVEIWNKRSVQFSKQYLNIVGNLQKEAFSTESFDEVEMIKQVTTDQGAPPRLNGTRGG